MQFVIKSKTYGDYIATVDDEDFVRVKQHTWGLGIKGRYVGSHINGKYVLLHTFIVGCKFVDHTNHDSLDNRKVNLRVCTQAQNLANSRMQSSNSSGFKGVSWDKSRNKYSAKISVFNKTVNLGRFKEAVDAARAYDTAARKYFGEFAYTNIELASYEKAPRV